MLIVDTSGSMYNFAYFDGFNTTATSDDHDCTSADPCSGFTAPGTYPTYKYYGYFDSDQWYTYASRKFSAAGAKSGTRPSLSWDGNWLNWLIMRRVDIVRKVLTGGKKTGTNQLDTEVADCDSRGDTKTASNASLYTPFSGSRTFTVNSAARVLQRIGIGGFVGHRQRHRDLRLPDDLHRLRRRSGPGDGRPAGHGGCEGPRRAHLLQHEHRRVRPGRHQRHEPNQRHQPYQYHPAHHEYAAGRDPVDGHGYFAQQASMLSGPGPRYASGDFTIGNAGRTR